jgi:hypothetical protein
MEAQINSFTILGIAAVISVFVFLVARDWWVKRGRARYRAHCHNKRRTEHGDPYEHELNRLFEAQHRMDLQAFDAMSVMLRESMRHR